MRTPIATAAGLAVAGVLTGCGGGGGGGGGDDARPSSTASPAPAPVVTVAPTDRAGCALLYARLQRVTAAISTSSELIAHSLDKRQLSRRIAIEQVQLERSARLLTSGPVPAPLAATTRDLVAGLRDFSRDFARAKAPAARGDFQGAVAAMTDRAALQRILKASQTIEDACK
jgi:hypothetical protein